MAPPPEPPIIANVYNNSYLSPHPAQNTKSFREKLNLPEIFSINFHIFNNLNANFETFPNSSPNNKICPDPRKNGPPKHLSDPGQQNNSARITALYNSLKPVLIEGSSRRIFN